MAENRSSPTSSSEDIPTSTAAFNAPSTLRHVVASMAMPIALLDRNLQLRAWSAPWARLAGHASERAADPERSPAFFDVFAEQAAWRERLERGFAGAADHGTAALISQVDRTEYWVDWEVQPWQAGDETVTGILLSLVDRSAQQRAEDRFRALADTVDEGVLLMGHSGIFQMCNARAESILGRAADDIVGSSVRDVRWRGLREDGTPLPNESFPFWVACYMGEPVDGQVMGIYPPEGPPRWVRVNARPLRAEGESEPYGVLAALTDITQQRLSEEALRTSKDLLSSVLSSSLDGIMVMSAVRDEDDAITDFEWLLVNPQAEKLLQRPAEDLVGARWLETMTGESAADLFEGYTQVMDTGEPLQTEIRLEDEAVDAWFQVVAVRVSDGLAITLRNVTERKQAVQQMATTNAELEARNQALREFAYIASHDLQEPLRKITAFADLMREDYNDVVDETGEYYLDRMQDAAGRMSDLITALLTYSRVTTRERPFEPVDLNRIVKDVCSDLDIRIQEVNGRVEYDDLPTIEADATQMRQLLQNLIGNGLKFHRPDVPPVVEVSATIETHTPDDDDDSESDEHPPERYCVLTVRDNGIGMEEKYFERIFSPFKRLHGRSQFEGTGMGLAICRRIAERHRGHIDVTSAPDEGTTFTIKLPVEHPESPGAQDGSSPIDDE